MNEYIKSVRVCFYGSMFPSIASEPGQFLKNQSQYWYRSSSSSGSGSTH